MNPADLVAALRGIGAAGCNLEDTNHATGGLRDPDERADWLRRAWEAARAEDYELVINARIDVFLSALMSGSETKQAELADEALTRANAYLDAGADCVFPILLREADVIRTFTSEARGPVNILALPQAPSRAELAQMGVARISYGTLMQHDVMEQFSRYLASLGSRA
jgi:2-methylisocitrate lyase-like PEP mutase family enzyme